ncbi:MAG: nucleotide exchange factor GrpE [Erysipelotrichaceae bacterium]|nr:nucleotide exchange factor GrpE [Erysipelotrichaceae bacterium]
MDEEVRIEENLEEQVTADLPDQPAETEADQEDEKQSRKEHKKEKKLSEVEKLRKEIEELKTEVGVTKNAYYKAYADTENLKKRLQAQADEANKYRIQSFAQAILPALDSLELALNGKDPEDSFVKGVRLTYDQILHALNNEGVEKIDCLNKPFDANEAHAIMTEKVEGTEPNTVIEVLQTGYRLKDRLLRAALVKVSE